MSIIRRKNLYQGVNAHLHSLLQGAAGGWAQFHAPHIIHLAEWIERHLPAGYNAFPERSFQITAREAADVGIRFQRRAVPDVTIDRGSSPGSEAGVVAVAPTLVMPITRGIADPEDFIGAVSIRAADAEESAQPIAWIELLSPTNKPGRNGFREYQEKRLAALLGGIVMVELDYLNQSPPIIYDLPVYPDEGSHPYYIALTDPRPIYWEGEVEIYGFRVDERIPTVAIPLLEDDQIVVDFGAIYQQTFESFR